MIDTLLIWIISVLTYILFITWQFKNVTNFGHKKIGVSGKVIQYDDQRQTKIHLNSLKAIHFFISFMAIAIGIYPLITNQNLNFYGELLPSSLELPFKIACSLMGTQFVLDLYYGRKYLTWDMAMHHIVSLVIIILVFDSRFHPNWMVRRLYICMGGCLLASRFTVFVASLYYYLGNENQKKVRFTLYVIGMICHMAFFIGQLTMGILYKIGTDFIHDGPRIICWIIIEIGVLPSQLISIYDLYCILRYKILSKEQYHIQRNLSEVEIVTEPDDFTMTEDD